MTNLSPRSKPRISYPPRNPILTPMRRSKDEPFLYFAVAALSPIYLPSPLCLFPHQLQPPPGGSSRFVLSFLVSLGAIDGPDCSVLPPSLISSGLTLSLFFPPAGFPFSLVSKGRRWRCALDASPLSSRSLSFLWFVFRR